MTEPAASHGKTKNKLIPVREAAKLVSYTGDYISKLAREGKIESELRGRNWFVDPESVKLFSLQAKSDKRKRSQLIAVERKLERKAYENGVATKKSESKPVAGLRAADKVYDKNIFSRSTFIESLAATACVAIMFLLAGAAGTSELKPAELAKGVKNIQTELADATVFDELLALKETFGSPRSAGQAAAIALAPSGFFDDLWCNTRRWLSLADQCPHDSPVIEYVRSVVPSLVKADPNDDKDEAAAMTSNTNGLTSIVGDQIINQYITNPTTIIRETAPTEVVERERVIVKEFITTQANATYNSLDSALTGLTDNLANTFTTSQLTVTSSTTLTDLTTTDTLTLSSLTNGFLRTDSTGLVSTTSISASDLPLTHGYVYRGSSANTAEATSSLYISDGGNVGIGTAAPNSAFLLDIQGSGAVQQRITSSDGQAALALGGATFGQVVNSTGDFYITNSAAADLIFRTNSVERFRVDGTTGFVGLGTTTPTSRLTVSGASYLDGTLTVTGTTTITDLSVTGDTTLAGDLMPATNNTYNIGSPGIFWNQAYINELNANNLVAGASTTIGGITNSSFLINSDNVSADTEDMFLIFHRGTGSPNALLSWDSTNDRFDFNLPVYTQSDVLVGGNVGVGTTSPNDLLDVSDGNIRLSETSNGSYSTLLHSNGDGSLSLSADAGNTLAGSEIRFLVDGSEHARLNNLGNFGIGTTTPSEKLHIEGDGQTGGLFLSGGDGGAAIPISIHSDGEHNWAYHNIYSNDDYADALVLQAQWNGTDRNILLNPQSDGNVGIGVSDPSQLLEIGASDGSATLSIRREDTTISGTDSIGSLTFTGDDGGIGTIGAQIEAVADGTWTGASDADTQLKFYTNQHSTGLTERLTIRQDGVIGVSSSTPIARFAVVNSASADDYPALVINQQDANANLIEAQANGSNVLTLTYDGYLGIGTTDPGGSGVVPLGWNTDSNSRILDIRSQGSTYDAGISLVRGDSVNIRGGLWLDGSGGDLYIDNNWVNDGGDIRFRTQTGGTAVDALTIQGTGNIGIGTTSPQEKLDVRGALLVQNNPADSINIGSASAASITFGQDGDERYMRFGAYNGLNQLDTKDRDFHLFSTAATAGLFFESSNGNVGIGTTSPDYRLHVEDTADVLALFKSTNANPVSIAYFSDADTTVDTYVGFGSKGNDAWVKAGGTERLRIDSSGQVGIGTTSPDTTLVVDSTAGAASRSWTPTAATVGLFSRSGGGAYLDIITSVTGLGRLNFGDSDAEARGIVQYDHANDSLDLFTAGTERLTIDSSGNVGIGTTSPATRLDVVSASGQNVAKFDLVGASGNTILELSADDGVLAGGSNFLSWSDGGITQGVIRGDGDFGIGTASPDSDLHILRTTSPELRLQRDAVVSTLGDEIAAFVFEGEITSGTEFDAGKIAAITEENLNTRQAGLGFFTAGPTPGVMTEKMRIDRDGNVGIATTTPSNPLTVIGNIEASNALLLGGPSTGASWTGLNQVTIGDATGNEGIAIDSGTGSLGRVAFGDGSLAGYVEYDHSSDTLSLAAGATETLFVNNGNVGIGTTAPGGKLEIVANDINLRITGAAGGARYYDIGRNSTTGYLDFTGVESGFSGYSFKNANNGTATTTLLTILNNGNVGIGTTTPNNDLHIAGDTNGQGLLFLEDTSDSSGGVANLKIRGRRGGGNQSGSFAGNVSLEAYRTDAAIDDGFHGNLGRITFGGNHTDGSASNILHSASIVGLAEGTFSSSTTMPTGLAFYTGSTGADPHAANTFVGTERMRIDASGNIGIGTSSPQSILHLVSEEIGTGQDKGLRISNFNYSQEFSFRTGITGVNNTTLSIYDETNDANRLVIDSSGSVGIGDTSPDGSLLLDVEGAIGATTLCDQNGANCAAVTSLTSGASPWSTSGSDIYYNSGNVGIGTSSPTSRLTLGGETAQFPIALRINKSGHATSDRATLQLGDAFQLLTDINGNGTSNFGIWYNGAFRFAIGSDGNVGIGTTTPSALLDTSGTIRALSAAQAPSTGLGTEIGYTASGDYGYVQAFDRDAGTYESLYLDSSQLILNANSDGNVGIGTTSPALKLSVASGLKASNNLIARFGTTDAAWQGLYIQNIGTSGTLIQSTETGVANNDLFFNRNGGDVGIGTTTSTARLNVQSSGTNDILNLFETSGTEVLTVLESGNVGIGTTSPGQLLEVYNSTDGGTTIEVDNPNTGTSAYSRVITRSNSGAFAMHALSSNYTTSGAFVADTAVLNSTFTNGLNIATAADAPIAFWQNSNEVLRIDTGGNVGIGTTSPLGNLHVYGGGSGVLSANTSADELVLETAGNGGLSILSPSSGTGRIYFGDPSDDDVGILIYNHSSDYMGFFTNAGERMRINSSGYVGIGTTSPVTALTSVGGAWIQGSEVNDYIQVESGASDFIHLAINGRGLYVDNAGSVGIGTTSPDTILNIYGSNDTDGNIMTIESTAGNPNVGNYINFKYDDLNSPVDANEEAIGGLTFQGTYSSNRAYNPVSAAFRAVPTQAFTASAAGTALTFLTTDNDTTTLDERMRIDHNGNVGIGTTSPDVLMHLYGTSGNIEQDIESTNNNAILNIIADSSDVAAGVDQDALVYFYTAQSGTADTEIRYDGSLDALKFNAQTLDGNQLVLTNTGAVGIGDSSPDGSLLLDVEGAIGASTLCDQNGANCAAVTSLTAGSSPWSQNGSDIYYTAGNVGIGTSSPEGRLHVLTGSAGSVTPGSEGDELVVESSGAGGISILGPDASDQNIYFGSPSDSIGAYIQWDHSTDIFKMQTANDGAILTLGYDNNLEGMRIDSGNVGIGATTVDGKLHVEHNTGTSSLVRFEHVDQALDFINYWESGVGQYGIIQSRVESSETPSILALNPEGGNVGIGTTSPLSQLTLANSSGDVSLEFSSTAVANTAYLQALDRTDNSNTNLRAEALTFNFTTSGSSRMYIDSSGNVGIGTSTPQFKLEIADSNSAGTRQGLRLGVVNTSAEENYDIYRYANDGLLYNVGNQSGISGFTWLTDSGSGPIERMTLTNAGNVGIGTTSPDDIFTVDTGAGADTSFVVSGSASPNTLHLQNYITTSGASGGDRVVLSEISSIQNSSNFSNYGAHLTFSTVESASALTERMRITNTGNVGIGTTSPTSKLHIEGSGVQAIRLQDTSSAGERGGYIAGTWGGNGLYLDSLSSNGWVYLGLSEGGGQADQVAAYTGGTERLRIDSSGNVGIGTTTPTAKLDVYTTASNVYALDVMNNTGGGQSAAHGLRIQSSGSGSGTYLFDVVGDYNADGGGPYNAMRILGNGNVGIGTSSPATPLEIARTDSTANFLTLRGDRTNGDSEIGIMFRDRNTVADGQEAARIWTDRQGTDADWDLVFSTSDAGGANTLGEAMRIDNVGNVGIGTSSPSRLLHVAGVGVPAVIDSTNSNALKLQWMDNGVSRGYVGAGSDQSFYVADSAGSIQMTVENSSGNVGIGTTTPTAVLTVNGGSGDASSLGGLLALNTSSHQGGLRAGVRDSNYAWIQSFDGLPLYINYLGNDTILNANSGSVGIGDSTPDGSLLLDVEGAIGATTLCDQNGANCAAVTSLTAGSSPWSQSGSDIYYNSGNVGIGTASPGAELTIQGDETETSTTFEHLITFNVSSGQVGTLYRDYNGSNNYLGLESFNVGNSVKTPIVFQEFGGNIGIGTTTPTARLTIAGATGNDTGIHFTPTGWPTQHRIGPVGTAGSDLWSSFNWNANTDTIDSSIYGTAYTRVGSTFVSFGTGAASNTPTERMRINGSGNVGIGTTSPVTQLHVYEASGNARIRIETDGADRAAVLDLYNDALISELGVYGGFNDDFRIYHGSDWRLTIDTSGNVGIGTTSPSNTLHLQEDTGSAVLRINSYDSSGFSAVDTYNSNGVNTTVFGTANDRTNIGFSGSGSAGYVGTVSSEPFAILTGFTNRLTVDTSGNIGIGTTSPDQLLHVEAASNPIIRVEDTGGAQVDVSAGGNWGSIGTLTSHQFALRTGNSDRLIIDTSGNVGIGTTTPSDANSLADDLVIYRSGNAGLSIIGAGSTGNNSSIHFGDDESGIAGRILYSHSSLGAGGEDAMNFYTNSSSNPELTIDSSGNVGIGTTSPAMELEVYNANARLSLDASNLSGDSTVFFREQGTIQGAVGYDNSEDLFVLGYGNAFSSPDIAINSSGNVGIGTTSPYSGSNLTIASNASGDALAVLSYNAVGDSEAYVSALFKSGTTNGAPDVRIVDADTSNTRAALQIQGGSGATEVAFFGSDGSVGIGTTSPSVNLDVYESDNAQIAVSGAGGNVALLGDAGGGSDGNLILYDAAGGNADVIITAASVSYFNGGNVGIGTVSPETLLHVNEEDATTAFKVTGGNSGNPLAQFVRDIGGNATTTIHSSGADPQIMFETAANTFALGTDGSSFKISDNTAIGTNDRLTIDSSGNIGIGTTSPAHKLHVSGGSILLENTRPLRFEDNSGTNTNISIRANSVNNMVFQVGSSDRVIIDSSGHVTPNVDNTQNLGSNSLHWSCLYYDATNLGTCSSDERLKDNIADLSFSTASTTALDKLTALQPRTFTWNEDGSDTVNYGLIAQEVLGIAPELVTTDEDGYYQVRYGYLQYLTLEAVQELDAMLEDLATSTLYADLKDDSFTKRFFDRLISWFGDATNGIGTMMATVFDASEKICVDGECLTADDIRALKASADINSDDNNDNNEDDGDDGNVGNGGGGNDDGDNNDNSNGQNEDNDNNDNGNNGDGDDSGSGGDGNANDDTNDGSDTSADSGDGKDEENGEESDGDSAGTDDAKNEDGDDQSAEDGDGTDGNDGNIDSGSDETEEEAEGESEDQDQENEDDGEEDGNAGDEEEEASGDDESDDEQAN